MLLVSTIHDSADRPWIPSHPPQTAAKRLRGSLVQPCNTKYLQGTSGPLVPQASCLHPVVPPTSSRHLSGIPARSRLYKAHY